VAVGNSSLYKNTTSNGNAAVGYFSLFNNTEGNYNTAQGYNSLLNNTTGLNNTAVGANAGGGITTGSNNTIIGADVTGLAAGLTSNIILANGTGAIKAQHDGTDWSLTGNVGIGTASPSVDLHVAGSGNVETLVSTTGNAYSYLTLNAWALNRGQIRAEAANPGAGSGTGSGILSFWTARNPTMTEAMRIDATGQVGIGTTSPAQKLHVVGEIIATGNITAYYSDDRLKTKLGDIENALDKVSKLNGFYYEANETAQALGYKPVREVGLSAQQVEAVLPEVVAPAPIDNEYKTLHYERVIPLLVEAIKELKAEIELLKK
jgi:hypothetical protein